MKKALRMALLAASACISSFGVLATVANKTHFSARNELQHNDRVWAASAPHGKKGFHADGAKGLSMDVSVFASKSTNTVGLGRHFGASARTDFSDANGRVEIALADDATTNALHGRQIDHTYAVDGDEAPMYGTVELRPFQKRLGAHVHLHGDLGTVFGWNGWHVDVTSAYVEVKNNLGLSYLNAGASAAGDTKTASSSSTLARFFAGDYVQSGKNAQQALEYGRLSGDDMPKSGLADLKVTGAYDVAREDDGDLQLRAGLIIPTGNRATARNVFEPLYGNGRHYGIVMGANGSVRLWENKEKRMSWWFTGDMEYTYLFSADEKRIAGIHDVTAGQQVAWGHAILATERGLVGTFPAANVITRSIDVTPGSHYEGLLGTTLMWKNCFFNLGYDVFFRRSEVVKFGEQWPADKYGLATYVFEADAAATDFSGESFAADAQSAGVLAMKGSTTTHIDDAVVLYQVDPFTTAAADQEVHSVVAGAGYTGITKYGRYTVSLSGAYEFPADTSKALKGWYVAGRLGVSF